MAVCCVCNKPSSTTPNTNRLIQCIKCKLFVHKECYGVVASHILDQWLCQRCLHGEGKERCHLCPFQDGALKKTDNGGWAHILCAQYIPEVIFGNNFSMEPINLAEVPRPRFQQICYVCDEQGNHVNKRLGACMQCNVQNCTSCFHVTCGQRAGLLVAEDCDDRRIVDYYGFCSLHVRNAGKTPDPPSESPETPSLQSISSYVGYYPPTSAAYPTQRPKEGSGEKISLPSVNTLPSAQLKNINHLLPSLNMGNTIRPDTLPAKMRPVQPRVRAYPLPFQGVHQQTNISLTSEISQGSELKYLTGDGQNEEYLPAPSLISTSGSASGITSSTTSSVCSAEGQRKRKVSSSTDTAESDGGLEQKEPLEDTLDSLQKIINDGTTSKLKVAIQASKEQKISAEAEGYNDLSTLFKNKKVKKKKFKSIEEKAESDYSDYLPEMDRKRSAFSKKGKKSKKSSKDPFKRSKSVKIKSPKLKGHAFKSPPKTPVKVEQSSLLCGAKGYSPAALVGQMLSEGKDSEMSSDAEKFCSNKPLVSVDCFFDRVKEMGMQYMINNTKSDKTKTLVKELRDLNQVNSYLASQLTAKAAQLDHLRKLNSRLAVPYTTPLKPLPEPAKHSRSLARLLKAVHSPATFSSSAIAEAEDTLVEEVEIKEPKIEPEEAVMVQEVAELPQPSVCIEIVQEVKDLPSVEEIKAPVTEEAPQIIIAGDPPVAWTCNKDGTVVGYKPSDIPSLHTDQYKGGDISRLLQPGKSQYKEMTQFNKVVEQQYKEKLLAQQGAYFEAQRRQYEGLLQHQLQTKLQGTDYLTQAYIDNWGAHAGYYYASHPGASVSQQQEFQRQMPPLTAHFPPQTPSQSSLNTISTFPGIQTPRPPSGRP